MPTRKPSLRVACAVLAAGLSSRFGSLKQLAKIGAKKTTLIQTAVNVANCSKADYVFIILGHGANEILEELEPGRAQIILNKDYSSGLSSSVRSSVSNLPEDCQALLLMVADQPFLGPRLIDRLIDTVRGDDKVRIASLAYRNEPRNPAIFRKEFFPLLQRLRGDKGARDIVKAHERDATLINIRDAHVFIDVDTFSSVRKIRRGHPSDVSATKPKKLAS